MSNQKHDEGNYKSHRIVVIADRLTPDAAWTLSVNISNVETEDDYPLIEDDDDSYETADDAIREGWRIAREVIDRGAF